MRLMSRKKGPTPVLICSVLIFFQIIGLDYLIVLSLNNEASSLIGLSALLMGVIIILFSVLEFKRNKTTIWVDYQDEFDKAKLKSDYNHMSQFKFDSNDIKAFGILGVSVGLKWEKILYLTGQEKIVMI